MARGVVGQLKRERRVVSGLALVVAAVCFSVPVADAITISQPGTDPLVPVATLTATSAGQALSFENVVISGSTIVANSFLTTQTPPYPNTGTFVFTERPGGWTDEAPSAELVATDGQVSGEIAIAGNDVFEAGTTTAGDAVVYAFVRPAGGWSGIVDDAAELAPSSPSSGFMPSSVAASGDAVLTAGQGSTDVFTEPDRGWSGTVHQAATLTASNEANFFDGGAAISGRFAFVGAGSVVDVFREPPGGWSGSVGQVGQLLAGERSVAVSGSTVVASAGGADGNDQEQLWVYSEPKSGWTGTVAPGATRTFTAAYDSLGPDIAISDSTVVAMVLEPNEHECPCQGYVSALSEPAGGWSGTTTIDSFLGHAPFTADVFGGAGLAAGNDGSTAVVGAGDGVHVYAVGVPPTLSHLALTGLDAGKPRLTLKLLAAQGSALSKLTLRLPNGLRLATRHKQRSDGITIDGTTKPRIALETRSVSIELKPPSSQISLIARAPALIEEHSLTAKLRAIVAYNKTHHRRHALNLALAIAIRNAAGQTTDLTAHVALPSGQ